MMHWLIDESNLFKFDPIPSMRWRVAAVGGAILPYEGRKIWLKSHKAILKDSDYTTQESICEVLDLLIKCSVKGILRIGDTGHISLQEANYFYKTGLALTTSTRMLNRNICENRSGFTSITLWERDSINLAIRNFSRL